MAERIDVPPTLQGDEKAQLQQVWSYLYQLSEAINNNLDGIGGNELTDSERQTMQMILSAGDKAPETTDVETLKSLIIKTADFVQNNLKEYRMNLLGETVASGKFGRYVRSTGLDVAVTPEGITQNYSFQEIIQGLKVYEINAKNYIKTGLLRTVSSIPVYGVAIGKDVVTFSEDGTETYNDGNKVAEMTADELSFWQNGVKVAGYTGTRISFYYNNAEVMYIQNGIIHVTGDFKIDAGGSFDVDSTNLKITSSNGEMEVTNGGLKIKKQISANVDYNLYIGGTFGNYYDEEILKSSLMVSKEEWILNGQSVTTYPVSLRIDDATQIAGYKYYTKLCFGRSQFYKDNHLSANGSNTYQILNGIRVEAVNNSNHSVINSAFQSYYGIFTEIDASKVYAYKINVNSLEYQNLTQVSSKEIKHDIQPLPSLGGKLDELQPVTFVYDFDENERTRMGLIYEDTVEVMPEICTQDETNKAINYIELVPALLKEIQDLRKRVTELERRIENVQGD